MTETTQEAPARNPFWGKLLTRSFLGIALILGGVAAGRVSPPLSPVNSESAAPRFCALLHIARTQPTIIPDNQPERPGEFDQYRRGVMALLRSDKVLTGALKREEVKRLGFAQEQNDPVGWLKGRLKIDSSGDTSLVRVGLDEGEPAVTRALVDAVVQSFMEEVAYVERGGRNSIVTTLEKACAEAEDRLAAKMTLLEKTIQMGGERDDGADKNPAQDVLDIKRELRRIALARPMAVARRASKEEIEAMSQQIELLKNELEPLLRIRASRPPRSAELDQLRADIARGQELVRLLSHQLDLRRLELRAPSRVSLFQAAEGR